MKSRGKSFTAFFSGHFNQVCRESSMHGAHYLCRPGLFFWERVLWFLGMFISGNSIFYWTSFFVMRSIEKPVSIAIERDHVNWETFFPVFTVCVRDKVNETALEAFMRDKDPGNADELEALLRWLVNLSMENLANERPPPVAAASSIDPKDYLSIIHQLSNAPDFYVTVDAPRSTRSFKLEAVMTEMGSCSTFNSRALSAMSWQYVLSGNKQPDQPVLKTSYAEGDVAVQLIRSDSNGSRDHLDIYFHSPLGIPAPASHPVTVIGHQCTTSIQLMSIDIVTHVKVKRVMQRLRKCLFYYEGQLPHSPHIYSHELCLRECRVDKIKALCGCLPHFYRLMEGPGERYCRPEEIPCIAHHLEAIVNRHSCHCYASCDDTTFHPIAVTRTTECLGRLLRFEIVPSRMRYRRDPQSSYEVAVSFGGCSSLFLGLSSISIMEFIFFYSCHMYRKYKLYRASPL